ncbi:hypothetical protein CKO38_07360 [Rhodospirillum rubrum]|uniref:DUF6880 family protein n=1 Tax=Rhodospirillum rubrum TaxID=1085 RepID=UPI00190651CC|nr:DUF6880 family protein [Rhodospirillum rubrum]MBK1663740.1 hypothetical protein [Rhodospirillum rubrum]MBK1676491.1 hypothetical protein [Rhodospirillum rubrum]
MASKTTVNAQNLEALGAPRLAALMIDITKGNAVARRRLRLELAGEASPKEVAREVRKRLATLARSRSFVDWQGGRALAADLETQRRAIVETVAVADPKEALDLLWLLLDLAPSVYERCGESNGMIGSVFDEAGGDLGPLAARARPDPLALADRVYGALVSDDYGQFDGLIRTLAPVLEASGLERLKRLMVALSQRPIDRPAQKKRGDIGRSSLAPPHAVDVVESRRVRIARYALQEIADVLGDVDAFIAQFDEETRKVPGIAADIASRLLAAGRAEEALQRLEAARPAPASRDWPDFSWEDAQIAVLEDLGRTDEAQAVRWECFQRSLSAPHLRDYLKQLPDFEDVEVEERALDHVQTAPSMIRALAFLVAWPALTRAASLVVARSEDLDGNQYDFLPHAADALAAKFPLASTLILRALIDESLTKGRATRYKHAARHLCDCASLAASIPKDGAVEPHEAYVARLRREHGRKTAFWALVG